MKRLITLVVLCLSALVWSVSYAHAQAPANKAGLAVSPPTFELSANPGEKLQRSIRVDNISDKPTNVAVERRNFTPLGEEGQASLTTENTPYSLASWITVGPENATIPARESRTFDFSVDVPPNAEPGGHFGSIVFKVAAPPEGTSGGVAVGQEVSSLLLLKVAGDAQEKAEIASFKPTQDFWEYGPIAFETRIKNTGNIHIKPVGTVTITDMFGHEVGAFQLDSRSILPNSIRKFDSTWGQVSLFGRYTATLSVSYGDKKQIITSTTNFLVIPYRMIIAVIIILALIGYFIYRGRRRFARSLKVLFGKEK